MPHLGERLKDYREGSNLTQQQMAELLDIGYRTYQEIEKTGIVAKTDAMERIGKYVKNGAQKDSDKDKYTELLEKTVDDLKKDKDFFQRLVESNLMKLVENQEVIQGQLKTSLQQDAIRDAGGDLKKAEALMKKTNKRLANNLGIEQTGNQISDSLSKA